MKKFLLMGDHSRADDPDESRARAEVQLNWIPERIADGSIDCVYQMADSRRLMIVNAESREALDRFIAAKPDSPTREWEIIELLDVIEVIQRWLNATSA